MASDTQAFATHQSQLLSATYKSPTNEPFTHITKLPTPPSEKPTDRTAYLGALRKATSAMQEQINRELTARMVEDKTSEAINADGVAKTKKGVDESKEEDNYGEEVAEED